MGLTRTLQVAFNLGRVAIAIKEKAVTLIGDFDMV